MLRAALSFDPTVPTFRGRGAWRVVSCWRRFIPNAPAVCVVAHTNAKQLYMDVPRHLRTGQFVNPTKLLREVLEQRRA